MSNRSEPLVPHFDRLPEPEQIGQMATWLAQAGLESLELCNEAAGLKLRIRVERAAPAATCPHAPPAAQSDVTAGWVAVKTPYFGHLCLTHPQRESAFAPVGAKVAQGDTVALLTLDRMQLPVPAPVAGTVVEVTGQAGALVGYGTVIMQIQPD
ncbi:acetyl-CoA carboxylase biotin carboxyl carrier protein subunit [Komagataeibacter xylinus]|uniref:Acetyl-CoA carboxylase biotin carboxyl carrier protein subunit n=1 Tax=Komagataeibacter xylinus TaxID=28448 RepID=A0A318PR16_KOMXY|nr:biotin/lipoyl-containing protein [Komagataeibacter xylinus]PYD58258.1 acetyl-CoA carboxylase biotin carboxyl carrier protein subunit [Komagataeibacter xylinus]GBQ78929.1 acetyl-CoA carboxylase biotin carboxyl carrier protein [Komagataeibacter xylinus NBRC 15237]